MAYPDEDSRLGITALYDGDECIFISFSDDTRLCDDLGHMRSLLLGRRSWKAPWGKTYKVLYTPEWNEYLTTVERPDLAHRSAQEAFLSRYTALFFPMHYAIDRLYWGSTLLKLLKPRCNYAVRCDALMQQELRTLVPDGSTEEVQISSLEKEGLVLDLIDEPSERVQIAAVRSNPYALADLIAKGITPSKQVMMAAAETDGHAIEVLEGKMLDDDVLLAAVRSVPAIIAQFDNPDAQLQREAVNADPWVITSILHPTIEAQVLAVSRNPVLFHALRERSEAARLEYLKAYPQERDEINQLTDAGKIEFIREHPERGLYLLDRDFVDHPIGSEELREPIIRELLMWIRAWRNHGVLLTIVERLRAVGYNWAELDIIEHSLHVDLGDEEA